MSQPKTSQYPGLFRAKNMYESLQLESGCGDQQQWMEGGKMKSLGKQYVDQDWVEMELGYKRTIIELQRNNKQLKVELVHAQKQIQQFKQTLIIKHNNRQSQQEYKDTTPASTNLTINDLSIIQCNSLRNSLKQSTKPSHKQQKTKICLKKKRGEVDTFEGQFYREEMIELKLVEARREIEALRKQINMLKNNILLSQIEQQHLNEELVLSLRRQQQLQSSYSNLLRSMRQTIIQQQQQVRYEEGQGIRVKAKQDKRKQQIILPITPHFSSHAFCFPVSLKLTHQSSYIVNQNQNSPFSMSSLSDQQCVYE